MGIETWLLYLAVFCLTIEHLRLEKRFLNHCLHCFNRTNEVLPMVENYIRKVAKEIYGKLDKTHIDLRIAEKLSDRAFSLASSANLGLMAIQRTLVTRPTYASKKQMLQNEVAQGQVTGAIVGIDKPKDIDYSEVDWMYAALDDEEREIVDRAREMAEAKSVDVK